ncbi:MAG: KH domain-containing protein [Betaproteobacteria bacterium]
MRELVALIARGLVREPGRVGVREHTEHGRTVLELWVAPRDRGRVIGREGRTASALRTLVSELARRRGSPCTLEILE